MNGAQVIAEILKREGTEYLFCYPRNPLIDACAEIDIRPILCRQERVGIGMADGYTRIYRGRRNGVFAVQSGTGAENAFPGVAQAYAENVPILLVSGGGMTSISQYYMEPVFRAADVFRPISKWSAVVHSIEEVPHVMRRAFHMMRNGKPGPVVLDIPHEVWVQESKANVDYQPVPVIRSAPDAHAVREAARMLRNAKNPVIWAGQGVLYSGASEQLVELAELLPAPVLTTNPGKSAMPENHPLALGASTRSQPKMFTECLRRADVVFAIGSSLSKTWFGPRMPPGKTVIHSTNAASDINKDYRADHAVIGDAALVLDALVQEIQQHGDAQSANTLAALQSEVVAIKKAWLKEWSPMLESDEIPINQYRVIRDLMASVDRDKVIITHDAGSPREQLLPFWEATQPLSYLGWGKSTQLGHGLGLIMGAKLAAPDKLCINIMGDSAIGMTGMDLETASRNGIASLTIVFNNGAMACERDTLTASNQKYDAMNVGGNYAKLAEALNVASRRVENPAEIVPAIQEAVGVTQSGAPFLLEFMVKQGYDFSRYFLEGL